MKWPAMTLAGGPVEMTERTLRDQSRPVLYHYDPAFIELFERTEGLLKRVFQTKFDVVIQQAEAILGLEAAAASMIAPGDKVLNLVSGVFGKWNELFITKFGGVPVELAVPYNESIDPDDVRRILKAQPDIGLLAIVHSETPSATINPMKEIGAIAKEHGVLTIVDTVSGLCGEAMSPESWGMDLAIAGPQKCLGGSPGLTLMSVSPDAWTKMESHPNPVRGTFLSILDWKTTWLENRRFPYTPSVSLMYALESVLEQCLEEGVQAYAERHQRIAKACRVGVRALGLELWAANDRIASPAVTGVKIPEGIEDEKIRGHMRETYGVMVSGGYGELAGKLIRLGHMGKAAHPTYLAAQLAIFERSLNDLGMNLPLGTGVGAAMGELGA